MQASWHALYTSLDASYIIKFLHACDLPVYMNGYIPFAFELCIVSAMNNCLRYVKLPSIKVCMQV